MDTSKLTERLRGIACPASRGASAAIPAVSGSAVVAEGRGAVPEAALGGRWEEGGARCFEVVACRPMPFTGPCESTSVPQDSIGHDPCVAPDAAAPAQSLPLFDLETTGLGGGRHRISHRLAGLGATAHL